MKKLLIGLVSYSIIYGFLLTYAGTVNQPPIISRSQRGADESLRLGNPPLTDTAEPKGGEETTITPEQKRKIADEYLSTNFPFEFRSDSTIRTWNNKLIRRPIQLNHKKFKIIIHHTAEDIAADASYDQIVENLQKIYKFHTISRRWGDIGYNYIIGPDGSIFEGRAGGSSAVGAHVVNNNGGSVGISLMGNFQNTEPTQKQFDSLIHLSAWIAQQYGINVYQKVSYHKASAENPYIYDVINDSLVGHKDAGDTSCPGTYLYNKLPYIKTQIVSLIGTKPTKQITPVDTTPTVTDPVKYYIPSTSYQLTIPRTKTDAVSSCISTSTTRSIKKCSLNNGFLTLHLNKTTSQPSNSYEKFTLQTSKGKHYLFISLEYQTPSANLQQIQSIPSTSHWFTGSKINVLLYEITANYNQWIIRCSQGCTLNFNTGSNIVIQSGTTFQITKQKNQLLFWLQGKTYQIPGLTLSALGGGVVEISNYDRSINNIKLNQRKGTLKRTQGSYKKINQGIQTGIVISNEVRIDDYLRGLTLGNPSAPQSYNDVLYLIAQNNVRYRGTIISDDARIHQPYGGANAEKINYKWQNSHDLYSNKGLFNEKNLSYAPWFECSNGITLNGIVDIGKCNNGQYSGLGLGASRVGVEMLSKRGYSTRQIIEYYYPGLTIKSM